MSQPNPTRSLPQPSDKLKELKRRLARATSLEDQAFKLLEQNHEQIHHINEHGLSEDGSDDGLARDLARTCEAFLLLRQARDAYEEQALKEGLL